MIDKKYTEELIHALDNSQDGFVLFKQNFDECALAFEVGDNAKGLKLVEGLSKPIQDFLRFCVDTVSTHAEYIGEDLFNKLCGQCESFENLIKEVLVEMEEENYVEVGDILKYDLGDLIGQMAIIFPKLSEAVTKGALSTQV